MPLSPGCAAAHSGNYAPDYELPTGLVVGIRWWGQFAAGERLMVSAGPPEVPGGYPSEVELYVATANGYLPKWDKQVACAAYPGTVAYTFLAGGDYDWYCTVPNAEITWTVNCGFAPPFNPVSEITALKARVAGLTIASSVKDPLTYDLDQALEALGGQAFIGRGRHLRNRALGSLRRSSTVARFLDWAWADPCSSLQTFIARVRAAYGTGQITRAQWCELDYTATSIRRMLDC